MRLSRVFLLIGVAVLLAACGPSAQETPSGAVSQANERVVVAWVDSGNLIVWTEGESQPRRVASGGVIRPYVAPDGQHVVFTRGPDGAAQSLWVVDTAGEAERQLAGNGDPRTFRSDTHIGEIAWLEDVVFYFNTLRAGGGFGFVPQNDLYRVNVRTREVALILRPGDGGRFSFSPDREKIALVYPGTYGRQDGRIRVIDPLALEEPDDLLFFIGVASGAELPFYPRIRWLPDSSAVLTAIPDKDLIYSDTDAAETLPATRLWRLPVGNTGDRQLIGSVQASFFGLPLWSPDTVAMLYMTRTPATNEFTAYIASTDGETSRPYIKGDAGSIQFPTWLPDSSHFYFSQGDAGEVWLGEVGVEPRKLSEEIVYRPRFISDDIFVFATSGAVQADGFQMRYARMGSPSQAIGAAGMNLPLFDAVLVKQS